VFDLADADADERRLEAEGIRFRLPGTGKQV
jgi:hypothetical protein